MYIITVLTSDGLAFQRKTACSVLRLQSLGNLVCVPVRHFKVSVKCGSRKTPFLFDCEEQKQRNSSIRFYYSSTEGSNGSA